MTILSSMHETELEEVSVHERNQHQTWEPDTLDDARDDEALAQFLHP